MFKITAIVSLMLIATWSHAASRRNKKEATASEDFEPGSTLWAASLSCDSCGSECASACGTRHFRSCCFNYLRKKRGFDNPKTWFPASHNTKQDMQLTEPRPRLPFYVIENISGPWMNVIPNDYKPYPLEDMPEDRVPVVFDA